MSSPSSRRGVLITGAADGIGRGIAETFAQAGDRVALLDIEPEQLERAVSDIQVTGAYVFGLTVDVRSSAQVERAVEQAVSRLGRLDITVSNAGVYPNKPVLEMDEAEWD